MRRVVKLTVPVGNEFKRMFLDYAEDDGADLAAYLRTEDPKTKSTVLHVTETRAHLYLDNRTADPVILNDLVGRLRYLSIPEIPENEGRRHRCQFYRKTASEVENFLIELNAKRMGE